MTRVVEYSLLNTQQILESCATLATKYQRRILNPSNTSVCRHCTFCSFLGVKFTMPENIFSVVYRFYEDYAQSTPKKMKMIDAYLLYIMLSGIVQFVYCCLVGTFPFNSFLSGFISCVGSFVLAGMRYYQCIWCLVPVLQFVSKNCIVHYGSP